MGELRQRRPIPKREKPTPISYQRFWREVTADGHRRCAVAESVELKDHLVIDDTCFGPIDAHHYVPKRSLDNKLGGKHKQASILAKTDVRNGVCLCRRHHDMVEHNMIECPRPPLLDFFLLDHQLTEPR